MHQSELRKQSELQQVEAEARAEGLRIGALNLTEELENTRQAIGMDLHDQTLADLSRIARALKRVSAKPSLRGAEVEPLQEDIEHCIRELRIIIDNAKPSVLQFFGFAQAVEVLLERSVGMAPHPLTCSFTDLSDGRIDELAPGKVVAIYRIVQEAINNAISHAEAQCITLELRDADGSMSIVIEDDGRGLSAVPWRRTGGLTNMQTRASLIQADLRATVGAKGQGTRLQLVLPAETMQRAEERSR